MHQHSAAHDRRVALSVTTVGMLAATLNSSNISEWGAIESDLRSGSVDVLLVSPERLANPGFGARVLDALAGTLGLLVVDEAHAVSDWGHDFRPDYRRVADTLRALNPATLVLATTATANERVTDDVAAQLGEQTLVLCGPLARSSLQLAVVDSLVLCRFTSERGFGLYVEEPYARMVSAVTGWDMTVEELERVGERVVNLERLFNVREGVRRRDDALPWRVLQDAVERCRQRLDRLPLHRRQQQRGIVRADRNR